MMSTTPMSDARVVCELPKGRPQANEAGVPRKPAAWRYVFVGLLLAALWIGVYESLAPVSKWLTYGLFHLAPGARRKSEYVRPLDTAARLS